MQAASPASWSPDEPAPPAGSGRTAQLQALFRIASLLGAPGRFRDNARKMLEVMLEVVDADRAVLRLPEPGSGDLVTVATVGPLMRTHPPAAVTRRGGPTQRAYRAKEVVVENDHRPGGRTGRVIQGRGVRSSVALPLLSGETVSGVLDVGSATPGFFSPERVYLLTARPCQVTTVLDIALARPRRYDMVTSPEFSALKARLLEPLWSQIDRSRPGGQSANC